VPVEESSVTATVSLPQPGAEIAVHLPWCVHHRGTECQSEETTIAGSSLSVWLAAAPGERPRLVIDQPGDYIEVVVRA
jgi:hypothetical protein